MAPSRIALYGLILALGGALAACSPPPPVATPSVVAPRPQEYTCDQQRRLAAEFGAMPADEIKHVYYVFSVAESKAAPQLL